MKTHRLLRTELQLCGIVSAMLLLLALPADSQTLLNLNFGATGSTAKRGFAATGLSTNDFWNAYSHYEPKFSPGMALVANGRLEKLRLSDGSDSGISVAVTNAPGVWGNTTGDPMYDSYIYSQNGSNIVVTIQGLPPGNYHFYLYGHADADVSGEQNSVFSLRAGTNSFGPLAQSGGSGWKAEHSWQERSQFVLFRDVSVDGSPVTIEVAPGPNGIAVLNGLQILSRGTSPPRLLATATPSAGGAATNLWFSTLAYEGKVSDTEARFHVSFVVDSMSTNELSAQLFEGDVALVSPVLPEGLRIVSRGRQTMLFCSKPGSHAVELELLAKISRAEPWNQISFTGPPAGIASVKATGNAKGVEMQLLSGTQVTGQPDSSATPSSQLEGFLGADRTLALRWQTKGTEVSRKSLVTVETTATAQLTPTVLKFVTALHYNILQAPLPRVRIALPDAQSLTRLQGEQIRDWQVQTEDGHQVLSVEFIRPIEKSGDISLFSEQSLESTPAQITLQVAQPLDVERETGSLTVSGDDVTVDFDSTPGLRQVNAPAGALAAYRFNARPFSVAANLKRIEPVVSLVERATARLEDTRLLVSHALTLTVEQAGIYALQLSPQSGFAVTAVKGDGIDDWKFIDGKLNLAFSARVLGVRNLNITLERGLKEFPNSIELRPLQAAGVSNFVTQLGVAGSSGLRFKTAALSGLHEIPVTTLPNRSDELLAFSSEQSDWQLTLAAEKLAPRVVTEVFDLVTIGDGLVGGSATLRYGIINQGVQQFRVAVPPHWKNVEFTGANIRRREQQTNVWTITLQDKAWGGYTLVITYDYSFDPKGDTLDLAGAHALDVERETGSLGLMTAANLKLTAAPPADPLRRVDEADLSETDRSLCTKPLLLAYKYTGGDYHETVQVTRFNEVQVLDAVADRTELTSVLTDQGQLLTQSSFMVKNNDKQFQRFKLPVGAEFWSSYVNGQPARPERDGDWFLVPLPREANRDQAFAVDIVYAQQVPLKTSLFPHRLQLLAPLTDVPNTYAEWQLFAPTAQRLSGFSGNMTIAAGTTYGLHDAWQQFLSFYGNLIDNYFGAILFAFLLGLVVVLIAVASRRGMRGAVTVLVLFSILAILAAMLLPALSRAKSRAQRISAVNNLKQIGLAAKTWSLDNNSQMPPSFEAMKNELGTEKTTIDPNTGQRFVYVGTGKDESHPEAIIAYSPSDVNGRAVLFADGSVQILSQEKFDAAMQRDAAVPRIATEGLGVSTVTTHADSAAVPQAASASQPTAVLRGFTPPQAALPSGGGIGGGVAFAPDKEKVMVSGVRPLRIEIPRAGQVFNFTKILNAGREPLTISASLMKLKVYRTLQMLFQVCAFGFGLLLLWALSLAARRSSFWMAIAAGLVLWSVTSLLTMWRLLHLALIVGVPLVPLALILAFSWKWWARRKAAQQNNQAAPPPTLPTGAGAGTGSAVAGIILLIGCVFVGRAGSAESLPQKLPDSVSIISASYTGSVHEKVAQFDATLHLSTTATNLMVPLFNEDVALESFTIKGPAKLVREGANAGVYVSSPGDIQLDLKLAVKLGGEVSRRRLSFALPPSLASHIQLLIDEPDADVEFPSAVAFEHRTENQQTRVDAVVGPVERLDLTWTPRMKRAAEIAATVFAQNTTLFTFGNGVVSTRTRLDYQISQGELRQIRLKLPAGQRVLRVEGESLRLWELNRDVLSVELLKGAAPAYQLTVETEQLLGKLPQTLTLDTPHALDVKRETGMVGVRGNEELALAITETGNLQRIDAEEFYRAAPDQKDGLVGAFRFARPEFNLAARVDVERPSLEATAYHRIRIEAESVRLDSRLEYTIKRAGIFSLRLALPADYRVDSVTGTNLVQWTERAVDGNRILEVTLKERTLGRYVLNTVLERAYPELPKNLALAVVHPLGTEKLSGFITVSTEMGIAAKTDTADGLTEIPFNAAEAAGPNDSPAPSSGGLAYKFISPNPGPRQEWALTILTEAVDPWVRAELMNSISLSENLVSGRTQIKYEIANAPVKELRLRIPSTLKNVEVFGAQIRRRDQTNDEWRVELQSKVRGEYIFTVTWELPKTAATPSVELPRLQALGVERETGFLALSARPPLQLTEATASQLVSKIDITELPAWAGRPETSTVLAYRYLRPDYKLVVDARRYDEAEVLQTLIDSARFTTVVADDGQLMTEMSLTVRNNGRQHLEIELPAGTTVWSAFVAGEPVRPSLSNGKLLLPLAREMASDAPVPVELTFVGTEPFPKHRGSVALTSPRFDVPLKNARWELYLPPDYEYSSFAGSMNRVSDAVMPVEQVYSLSEYNEQTKAQALQEQEQVRYGLQSARQSLSGGNLREAVESLSRARVRGKQSPQLGEEEKDLKKVADDLRRAQSSNLVAAQNNYFYENAAKLGEVQTVPQGGVAGRAEIAAGDAFKGALDVAGLQWDKLEKAQQVSVAKVSPLRVNLPTRGIHYAFAQVLQTELRKPMTIRLHAESTKAPNWLGRITLAVGGFGLLWACIALMNYRRARNLPTTA